MNYSFDSNNYWENRYKNNNNSGHGSYEKFQEFKTEYINNVIKKYNIKTINELGSGDGNMLRTYSGFDLYTGFDVSDTILNKLKNEFKDDSKIKFVSDPNTMELADLTSNPIYEPGTVCFNLFEK